MSSREEQLEEAMDYYAVMGSPVKHSKSPWIHAAFAAQTEETLEYYALLVKQNEFVEAVELFFSKGGKGLNITVPFKEIAWQLATEHSEDAELAGAVNTLLKRPSGKLVGHNTDGVGLIRDIIQNHGGVLAGKSVLVLGAGGASRGILGPLLRELPLKVCVANRTVSKAEKLAGVFASYGDISACGYSELEGKSFDWVINATSASLYGDVPPIPESVFAVGAWCYDLMYSTEKTPFCHWAEQAGVEKTIDGLGMLVEQAAEAFYLWREKRPETANILKSLQELKP